MELESPRPRAIARPSLTQRGAVPIAASITKPKVSEYDELIFDAKKRKAVIEAAAKRRAALPVFNIERSSISVYSWKEMQNVAPVNVNKVGLSGKGTVNDPRMGSITPNVACQLCGQLGCAGHYGLIEFGPNGKIYNPFYIREVVSILVCVCNFCGRLLVRESVIVEKGFMKLTFVERLKALEKECVKITCKYEHSGTGYIACVVNPKYITTGLKDEGIIYTQRRALSANGSIEIASKVREPLPINTAFDILNNLYPEDIRLLGFPVGMEPVNLIMQGILVLPTAARPPVLEHGTTYNDQFTHMYASIVRQVQGLVKGGKGKPTTKLYSLVRSLFFKTEGNKMGHKDFLSVVERIQGKGALIREAMMGKRNDFCGRTVSSPDPSLKFGQIRIPRVWAPILTKPIRVTNFNLDFVIDLANMIPCEITHISRGYAVHREVYKLKDGLPKIGDRVHRYLQNGDRVMINRQPTLRKQSLMGYEVVLGNQLGIGLHLSYTTPTNNDFDGDENNCWDPQDFEVEAEVEEILNVKHNVMSTEQNRPIMGMVMNSVTAFYLLTSPGRMIQSQSLYQELLGMLSNTDSLPTLTARLKLHKVHPMSGRALFSALLPPDFYYEKTDTVAGQTNRVIILNGILVNGIITKANAGPTHRALTQTLWKDYGQERTAAFFTDAPWLANKWIMEEGFTTGLLDVLNLDPSGKIHLNRQLVAKEIQKIYREVELLGPPLKDPFEEEFRRRSLTDKINAAASIGAAIARNVLGPTNSIAIMTKERAGTKGENANIGQIMGSVAQQFFRGEPLKPTLTGNTRLLPAFDRYDTHPVANAYIPESYEEGITPEGYFYTQTASREGLLDTALKTAETGTIQRSMTKALENAILDQDGSVRNTIGTLFQLSYPYNIGELVNVGNKEYPDLSAFMDIKATVAALNIERGWYRSDMLTSDSKVAESELEQLFPGVETFKPTVTTTGEQFPVVDVGLPIADKVTVFEKARLIGTRAVQLANGDPSKLTDLQGETDAVKIATAEYNAGLIDLEIIRKYTDGSYKIVIPDPEHI